MGKSLKKEIVKRRGGLKDLYNRLVRKVWKRELLKDEEDMIFEDRNAIVNKYDFIDGVTYGCKDDCFCVKKFGFKKCFRK